MNELMTMQCARHGPVSVAQPMPGSPPLCRKCGEEQQERDRIRHEAPFLILERLTGIEGRLERVERMLSHLAAHYIGGDP